MRGLATLLLLVGCAGGPPVCDGAVPMTQLTAYLGGSLSERDWRDPEGRIIREASRTLTILAEGDARARFAPVEAAYRARFAQRSVLVTTQGVCARF
jgi:hypothetical protein